jgi:AmiR/NasT family two-component response regulator
MESYPETLLKSVAVIADLAVRHTGAQGYALYGPQPDLAEPAIAWGSLASASRGDYRLRADDRPAGTLVFVFAADSDLARHREALGRIVKLVESLLGLFHNRKAQLRIATRISALEADLAVAKVLERANGLLNAEPGTDLIEALDRHLQKVLASCEFQQELESRLGNLERRMAERGSTVRAKSLLQSRLGLSEQQAYGYLRVASRRRRKKMGEIALDILAGREPLAKI